VLPPAYCAAVIARTSPPFMFTRAASIPAMADVEARFRLMDAFPGYRQIISLGSPPVEALGHAARARDLARVANDAMAEWVEQYPDRFAGFVAALPLNDPDASLTEATRAYETLGALGVQLFSSVNSQPLDAPELLSIIDHTARAHRAIWLHPVRPMARPDYPGEAVSKFDMWWAFGWPYETSLAMARLVFSGIFDRWPDLVVIAHHAGGIVPMLEGRLAAGLDQLGTRTAPEHEEAIRTPLRERPVDAFRRFHADTASFGSHAAIACAMDFFGIDRVLFATDIPFGPEGGAQLLRDTIQAIDKLPITEQQRRAILVTNAQRILGI